MTPREHSAAEHLWQRCRSTGLQKETHPLAHACDCDASVAFQLSGGVFWCRDLYPLCSQGSSALVALLGEVPA